MRPTSLVARRLVSTAWCTSFAAFLACSSEPASVQDGATGGKDVAVSWYRTEDQGRVFFTNFAKVDADLKDPTLGAGHIVPGLAWVLKR